jgi:hypothetical protein
MEVSHTYTMSRSDGDRPAFRLKIKVQECPCIIITTGGHLVHKTIGLPARKPDIFFIWNFLKDLKSKVAYKTQRKFVFSICAHDKHRGKRQVLHGHAKCFTCARDRNCVRARAYKILRAHVMSLMFGSNTKLARTLSWL